MGFPHGSNVGDGDVTGIADGAARPPSAAPADREVRGRAPAGIGTRPAAVAAIGFASSRSAARIDDPELQAQTSGLQMLCERRGWQLVSVVHETGRGRLKGPSRPSVAGALTRLARGEASCLLVMNLSRLCSSAAELAEILEAVIRAGGRLVSLNPAIDTGTRAGQAATTVLISLGEWERVQRTERSRVAAAAARARGHGLPMIDPALKKRIVRMRRGGMTLREIVDELNDAGVPTVRGGKHWRPSSVQAAIGYRRPSREPKYALR
jgi:DNA invertase Pin-like site-specific DNA recombinase